MTQPELSIETVRNVDKTSSNKPLWLAATVILGVVFLPAVPGVGSDAAALSKGGTGTDALVGIFHLANRKSRRGRRHHSPSCNVAMPKPQSVRSVSNHRESQSSQRRTEKKKIFFCSRPSLCVLRTYVALWLATSPYPVRHSLNSVARLKIGSREFWRGGHFGADVVEVLVVRHLIDFAQLSGDVVAEDHDEDEAHKEHDGDDTEAEHQAVVFRGVERGDRSRQDRRTGPKAGSIPACLRGRRASRRRWRGRCRPG